MTAAGGYTMLNARGSDLSPSTPFSSEGIYNAAKAALLSGKAIEVYNYRYNGVERFTPTICSAWVAREDKIELRITLDDDIAVFIYDDDSVSVEVVIPPQGTSSYEELEDIPKIGGKTVIGSHTADYYGAFITIDASDLNLYVTNLNEQQGPAGIYQRCAAAWNSYIARNAPVFLQGAHSDAGTYGYDYTLIPVALGKYYETSTAASYFRIYFGTPLNGSNATNRGAKALIVRESDRIQFQTY